MTGSRRWFPHDARDRYDHHPIRGAADPQRETRPEEHRKDLGNLDELAVSLRVNGMQQPIIVNATGPNTYRLVDGARPPLTPPLRQTPLLRYRVGDSPWSSSSRTQMVAIRANRHAASSMHLILARADSPQDA